MPVSTTEYEAHITKPAPKPDNQGTELSRNAKKRKAYAASDKGRERRAKQHHQKSQERLTRSIAGNSIDIQSSASFDGLPKSINGASGSRSQLIKDEIGLLRTNHCFRIAQLKTFRVIPYR